MKWKKQKAKAPSVPSEPFSISRIYQQAQHLPSRHAPTKGKKKRKKKKTQRKPKIAALQCIALAVLFFYGVVGGTPRQHQRTLRHRQGKQNVPDEPLDVRESRQPRRRGSRDCHPKLLSSDHIVSLLSYFGAYFIFLLFCRSVCSAALALSTALVRKWSIGLSFVYPIAHFTIFWSFLCECAGANYRPWISQPSTYLRQT